MTNKTHIATIAGELGFLEAQVKAVTDLLEQGSTIPFIARYRKEVTGSLDEIAISSIHDRIGQLEELDSRRQAILQSLEKHGHLTEELESKVESAQTLAVLEDIYLPFRPKRRTKATIAKEKGLEPLALLIFEQTGVDPQENAALYCSDEKNVHSSEEALAGARDIIAEMINEDTQARAMLRNLFFGKGRFICKVASDMEEKGVKYKDYFEWEEPISKAPSHRVLAMRRGEKEDILNLTIAPPEDRAISMLEEHFVKGNGLDSVQVAMAVKDCYKRLLSRSMETEARLHTKEKADEAAIKVFAENLRQLLLSPPLGPRRVLGIDPGYRTGCKTVCLDRQGKLLYHDTVYPHGSKKMTQDAADKLKDLCSRFKIEAVAVGNGTAGRETEAFVKSLPLPENIQIILVNESGASIYSASETARDEFPDLDLTVRGAVSIGRRLMDPLSELVKIDPKSIGVGQYQHDVDQSALKKALDNVVVTCVNNVGVDANRASVQLLQYISGLGEQLAKNILTYRDENGPFHSRSELRNVPRLGPKAFEQAAGFLRIHGGVNPLDASAVHPESYYIADKMAGDMDCSLNELLEKPELRKKIDISKYVSDSIGLPTLNDILAELAKPGRDPRETFEEFAFAEGIEKIDDLKTGMRLPGIVTNITAFGAFVDIGVHQDGLIHISQLADRFVKNPSDVVKVNQKVMVTVLECDKDRKRISLSMKATPMLQDKKKQKPKKNKPNRIKKETPKNRPFNNPFADLLKPGGP